MLSLFNAQYSCMRLSLFRLTFPKNSIAAIFYPTSRPNRKYISDLFMLGVMAVAVTTPHHTALLFLIRIRNFKLIVFVISFFFLNKLNQLNFQFPLKKIQLCLLKYLSTMNLVTYSFGCVNHLVNNFERWQLINKLFLIKKSLNSKQ